MTPPLMVSAKEAARILGLSTTAVYELAASGVLERRYTGARNYKISYTSLEEYVRGLPTEPADVSA